MSADLSAYGRACFVRACELDVAVRKPGNVSRASPGHGMGAALFIASAQAAVGPLFERGTKVGVRIESAVAATAAVAGCNTNLGIVLLCAPIAAALEGFTTRPPRVALQGALLDVLAALDVDDARAAYRAIAAANPGGLGAADEQDVHELPTLDLRRAMALAAPRDSIARQYRDGYADLFELLCGMEGVPQGFPWPAVAAPPVPDAATVAAVQRLYLALLSRFPDSHIVRKRGPAVAQTVISTAQRWQASAAAGRDLDGDPAFIAWDEVLKREGINPGTTADLTVATLLLGALRAP